MADQQKKQVWTTEEVQQAVTQPQAAMAQPAAYTQVTGAGQVPTSSAWRDVARTGNAKTDYKAILGAQPGSYQSRYAMPIQDTMNALLNQQPFNYNVNTDALYQNIKDQYIRQGRQAMMDTQGQAAALSGGYGNSYGVQAGQQAYQDSLGQLSARIPELYQLAYQRYQGDEASRRNNLAALQGLDDSEYQRYQYDTQQYEARVADAYAKYKAASGGSGRGRTKRDFEDDLNYYYGPESSYSTASGLRGDAGVDAAVAAGVMDKQWGEALKQGGAPIENYQRSQASAQDDDDLLREILGE